MDEHYDVPGWVQGTVWDELSSEEMGGRYSTFLEAVELSGYRDIVDGKGVMTVIAPDNEAFATYLKDHGYVSVKDMSRDELRKLVGFHLLYYSYNKSNMENFRPEGQGAGDGDAEILDPGMYYKFRTRSTNVPTDEYDPLTDRTYKVYHLERFLPVFSHYFFTSKKIEAKSNYEYFFPNSTWTGDDGFNIAEATVKDYALIANNGYIYTVDKVLEPMETLYDELKGNAEYSEFLALYDKFSTYSYDANLSELYGEALGTDSLYLHKHKDPLAPIALEWPVSDYRELDTLSYKSYSLFAPNNTALDNFYNSYWKEGGYESIDDLDPLVKQIFLNEWSYGGSVVFPEEISNGSVLNSSGVPYAFDPYKVRDRKMCVNGSFYGIDEIATPLLFGAVSGPAFQDKEYRSALYLMETSGLLNSFANQKTRFTLLIPSNAAIERRGWYLHENVDGTFTLAEPDGESDEGFAKISSSECERLMYVHSVLGEAVDLKKSGTQVVPIQSSYNYWYLKDGKMTCSYYFNRILNPEVKESDLFVGFRELTDNGKAWSNGKAYTYEPFGGEGEGLFDAEPVPEDATTEMQGLQYTLATSADPSYPYYVFAQLLKKAGVVSGNTITILSGRTIAFIPENEVLLQALDAGKIPGAGNINSSNIGDSSVEVQNKDALRNYLSNYFLVAATITTCPYPGSAMLSGEYTNYDGDTIIYTDNGTSLSIQKKGENKVCPIDGKYWYFPFAYGDGCFHLIKELLF